MYGCLSLYIYIFFNFGTNPFIGQENKPIARILNVLHSCADLCFCLLSDIFKLENFVSVKNRKDRNKVDRKSRKKGKFSACIFKSSSSMVLGKKL